jgi:hypothetical protein
MCYRSQFVCMCLGMFRYLLNVRYRTLLPRRGHRRMGAAFVYSISNIERVDINMISAFAGFDVVPVNTEH